jgi:hypothetical protein
MWWWIIGAVALEAFSIGVLVALYRGAKEENDGLAHECVVVDGRCVVAELALLARRQPDDGRRPSLDGDRAAALDRTSHSQELAERVDLAERDLAMERIAKPIILERYREAAQRLRESRLDRDVREAVEAATHGGR